MSSHTLATLVDSAIPFLGGLWLTLIAYRIVWNKPGDSKWEAWHKRFGRLGKWLGPALMVFSIILPLLRTRVNP